MTRSLSILALALLVSAPAAAVNTTITVNASGSFGTSGIAVTGTASLTNLGSDGSTVSGTIAATVSLTPDSSGNLNVPFTITITTGGPGTILGTVKVPPSALAGGPLTGSATVTSGTGNFAGATGSFPSLTGTGSVGATITLSFTGAGTITLGGAVGPPTPTITDVLDAGGYTKNIAQGSIFVVKGTTLSASGFNQFQFPLPTSSGGVKITFTPATGGGAGTDAFLIYTYNQSGVNQLAGVLPSTLAAGNYNVTVTNGTVSAPFAVQVVQRKIGLITADSTGSGLAVIQNFISASRLDIDRFTTFSASGFTFSPARPGQVLIAWATGMGPVSGGDNTASPGFDFAANGVTVRAIVGGVAITPLYAGRAPGLAGADQINFQLPADIPTGCTVSFQVSVNGALSNPSFIAIAPDANASACVQPGFTTAQLQRFDQGAKYTLGSFGLSQISETLPSIGSVKLNTASGLFAQITGFQLASQAGQTSGITSPGSCQVLHSTNQAGSTGTGGTVTYLDAGAITLNGPSGSNISNLAFKQDASNIYSLALASEGLPSVPGLSGGTGTIVAGRYTLTGAGGKDVKAFNAAVTAGTPLTITGGLPSTVIRNSGLTLNWTGGLSSDLVEIFGSSSTSTGTGANLTTDTWSFICFTTAGPGTFTVPASILNQLPAAAVSANGTGGGFLFVFSTINPTSGNGLFTADLTAGGSIDGGFFIPTEGSGAPASFQ
jgi:uncharacterized protein (TIGR03437 family)